MKNSTSPIEQLNDIRQMMEKSTRFLSLSGLSGISAGVAALLGSLIAWLHIRNNTLVYNEYFRVLKGGSTDSFRTYVIVLGLVILVVALASAWYFSWKKARQSGENFWSPAARRMMTHMLVPLATGGILTVILILQNNLNLAAPLTLIFYGLALLNAVKFTRPELAILGYSELAIGLLAVIWQQHGLIFWAIGFGVLHIVYGSIFYYKYDRS